MRGPEAVRISMGPKLDKGHKQEINVYKVNMAEKDTQVL